ncbi:hypothetical protein OG21DRAFT_1506498 [Imleria badia]|nr:hypothetical protein OG21DRAFT_1506498 [Imleria badia]
MAPLIPDGVYKIRNGEFHLYLADLINGNPLGAISGYKEVEDGLYNRWKLQNRGGGGNQITIQNDAVHGSFANVRKEDSGAPLVGSKDHAVWTVVKVDEGMFYLQSEDGQYVWELPKGADYEPIVLRPHTAKENQKWTFEIVLPMA